MSTKPLREPKAKPCPDCKADMIRVDRHGKPKKLGEYDACPKMLAEYAPERFGEPYRFRVHAKPVLHERRGTARVRARRRREEKATQQELLSIEEAEHGKGWVYAPKKSPGMRVMR